METLAKYGNRRQDHLQLIICDNYMSVYNHIKGLQFNLRDISDLIIITPHLI